MLARRTKRAKDEADLAAKTSVSDIVILFAVLFLSMPFTALFTAWTVQTVWQWMLAETGVVPSLRALFGGAAIFHLLVWHLSHDNDRAEGEALHTYTARMIGRQLMAPALCLASVAWARLVLGWR